MFVPCPGRTSQPPGPMNVNIEDIMKGQTYSHLPNWIRARLMPSGEGIVAGAAMSS